MFITANTGPTTITDFDGGIDGMEIVVMLKDANTTIDMSANPNIVGNGGVDLTGADTSMRAVYYGGVWHATT